jgi:outer membrane protein assembly factor BamE (lipoprotein component of BamABCDE complex)
MRAALLRASVILALCVLAGCATQRSLPPPKQSGDIPSVQKARDAIVPGKSTKADVLAALGKGVVIDFDSGYEVWVYHERVFVKEAPPKNAPAAQRPELVVLFDPSGVVSKTRVR